MSLRFFTDHCVSNFVTHTLRDAGHEVFILKEHIPPSHYKGIIALQVRNHPEVLPVLMQRLMNYLADHPEMQNYQGQLFLVEAHRMRIRK